MRAYIFQVLWLKNVSRMPVTSVNLFTPLRTGLNGCCRSDIQVLERPNISKVVEKASDTIA